MSFFSSKKAPTKYRLIVDLEPQSVGLGLALQGSTALEFIDRQYISYGQRPDFRQMQAKLAALLKSMLQGTITSYMANGEIASILCIHSAAWSIAETHTVDLQFPKPVKVQEKLIIDSVRAHRNDHVVKAQSNNLELVYHRIQKVRLNGYYADVPWDKSAQNISCDVVEGYIDASMKKFCEDVLLHYEAPLTHVPEAFIVTHAAAACMPEHEDALLVHIAGETTEVVYGNRMQLKQSASSPAGITGIIRDVAAFTHGDESLAFSHINMAARAVRIPTKKEQTVIAQAVAAWRNEFVKAVNAVCADHVPEQILFFSSVHDMAIAEYMLQQCALETWSNKKHQIINLFGKKSFQHDFMIAAGALYVVE